MVDKSVDENIEEELLAGNKSDTIEIQNFDRQHQNKVITAIVDKELCLIVEVRDNEDYADEYDSAIEVLGLATHSNSQSTVSSYASIFDTLWIQSELRGKTMKDI